ncbi:MAG: hypothetical protein PHS44_01535 [Candidatus Dojkabacteria bacterium]|jgi:hypothetical protein|nr:hypothetical protein [Candidatus Dojkabacteria bacterium]
MAGEFDTVETMEFTVVKNAIKQELESVEMPPRALLVGNLSDFVASLKTLRGPEDPYSIGYLAPLLSVIREMDLRLLGINFPRPPKTFFTKSMPAYGAAIAGLPYPQTFLVISGKWSEISPFHRDLPGQVAGGVIKLRGTSGGEGVTFTDEFRPHVRRGYAGHRDKYVYQRAIEHD